MFDNYHISPRPQHVSMSVEEKRAPTDDSVKLLREMEDAARAQVIQAIRLDGNDFKGVLHKQYDTAGDQDLWKVVFDLNGKRITATCTQQRGEPLREFCPRMAQEVGEVIATHILGAFSAVLGRK